MRILFLFFLINLNFCAQEVNFDAPDSLYREDQFYAGITYNVLQNRPTNVSQNSFSTGLQIGFLRDFPINKKRTWAIAPGFGFSFANYKQNLVISNLNSKIEYNLPTSGVPIDKNKFTFCSVDLPIEVRWRNSTPDSHIFWRIYSGFKLSYLFYNRSQHKTPYNTYTINNNSDFNKLQYGVYIAAGYNTWNFYAYYGLNSIFKKAQINNQPIEMKSLNLGLQFYIL